MSGYPIYMCWNCGGIITKDPTILDKELCNCYPQDGQYLFGHIGAVPCPIFIDSGVIQYMTRLRKNADLPADKDSTTTGG